MKRLILLMLTAISILSLSACQENEKVNEEDVKAFLKEYKSITHNADGEKDILITLEEVKPYLNDEWYKLNERDRRVNFPNTYAHASTNKVQLNDVRIESLDENTDEEGYKVKYTLLLTIGENNEEVDKGGNMVIIKGGPKGFTITYDWESLIIFDKFQFR